MTIEEYLWIVENEKLERVINELKGINYYATGIVNRKDFIKIINKIIKWKNEYQKIVNNIEKI